MRVVPSCVCCAADALGIPYLTPYLAGNTSEDYAHGANFAVGGATALGHDYFRKKKLDVRFTPYSLGWQTSWLKEVLGMLSSEQGGNLTPWDCSQLAAQIRRNLDRLVQQQLHSIPSSSFISSRRAGRRIIE
jgi:hypothetical protein